MKSIFKIVILLFLPLLLKAQRSYVDSIYLKYQYATTDSARYYYLHNIYGYYEEVQKDSALYIAKQMLELSNRNKQNYTRIVNMGMIGYQQMGLGDYSGSLTILLKALELSERVDKINTNTWSIEGGTRETNYPKGFERQSIESQMNHYLGNLLFNTGNVAQAEKFYGKARIIGLQIGYSFRWGMGSMNLGRCFLSQNKLDAALVLEREADSIAQIGAGVKYLSHINTYLGDIAQRKGQLAAANMYYHKAINYGIKYQNFNGLLQAYFSIAKHFLLKNQPDSSLFYSKKCLQIINVLGKSFSLIYVNKGSVYQNIYESYLLINDKDSINKYRLISLELKDSISKIRIKTLADFQNTLFDNQLRLQSLEKEKILSDNKNKTTLFSAGLILVIAISMLLYRNNRTNQKANKVLQEQKEKVESTLHELKSTQSQLIQSEKMASLGELTAGIAHEIQNPLNFVNNFSELNAELSKELQDLMRSLGPATAERSSLSGVEVSRSDAGLEMTALIDDISSNSEKINHHGQRAASIVKGMLQHSRTSTGQKELTDINALCDEYLRLAYHGLRAKDKTFNAEFKTEFDPNLPKVNVVPQDIGRVVLNIINNAFFAVGERSKVEGVREEGVRLSLSKPDTDVPFDRLRVTSEAYVPLVSVSTRKQANTIEVTISDNGGGIPTEIKEKIFQPFFTTKPTGQGTGLGLSLAYDIVTKVHGGKLTVESEQGNGTIFKIEIPI